MVGSRSNRDYKLNSTGVSRREIIYISPRKGGRNDSKYDHKGRGVTLTSRDGWKRAIPGHDVDSTVVEMWERWGSVRQNCTEDEREGEALTIQGH